MFIQKTAQQEFFQRKEVKDAATYLKLIINERDDQSLLRIIGTPPRGIGDKAILRMRDLKKAAPVSGSKSIAMILQKTLLPLTGYIHGGCSPIGMKKQFPTFIEETAQLYDFIGVSGGRIGLTVVINPQDLATFINAQFADLEKSAE